mmetsp:Transcript_58108/g.123238  ORF Transcript_58108/g.123238 Transcript_58108/m.123238 type:complete len:148 (+) Transcript_58108:170-613(+)
MSTTAAAAASRRRTKGPSSPSYRRCAPSKGGCDGSPAITPPSAPGPRVGAIVRRPRLAVVRRIDERAFKRGEEAMDETTTEKLRDMHLWILKLREENDRLRERTRRMEREGNLIEDGKSAATGMADDGTTVMSGTTMDQYVSISCPR